MRKKIVLVLLCIALVSALSGCGKTHKLSQEDYTQYVTLCDYKGIEADKIVFEITDEQVQEEIQQFLYGYVDYKQISDRAAEIGDYVVVDYSAKLDGKDDEDYSGEDEELVLGEGFFYPEAEDVITGMKIGETKSVNVELTEDYADEEDVGKTLQLDIKLKSISEEIVPEYNLDFVKENTDYKTIEEFEKSIRKDLEEEKKEEYDSVSMEGIMNYILDNSTFNGYPQALYDEYEEYYDASNENNAAMFGMELDEFLEQWGIDEETKKEEIVSNLNNELVIGAIAQLENIECTEKEIDKFVKDNYEKFEYESAEEFFEDYSRDEIAFELVYEKVMDFLLKNANLIEIKESEFLEKQAAEEAQYYEDEDLEEIE